MRRDKHNEAISPFSQLFCERTNDAGRVMLASVGGHGLNLGVQWQYVGNSLNSGV